MSSHIPSELRPERLEKIAALNERIGRELATKTVLFHHHLAARLGLSATDLKCFDLLAASDAPRTASNLAALTGLSPGAITGVADRLEAAGFVERVRDPADRRRWELRPTSARQDDITALFAPLQTALADLCAHYDDDQLDVITGFLAALGHIMDNQIQRLRTPADAC
jgi:DNA-binding MarR family transcriptional regulator